MQVATERGCVVGTALEWGGSVCDAAEFPAGAAERVAGGESGTEMDGRWLLGVGQWWLTVWASATKKPIKPLKPSLVGPELLKKSRLIIFREKNKTFFW